jgi:hypothetical protein
MHAGLAPAVVGAAMLGATFAEAADKQRMLVPALTAEAVDPGAAAVLSAATCAAAAADERFEVLCGDELRSLLELSALTVSLKACEGEACGAAAARALSARFSLGGIVARVQGAWTLRISLRDAQRDEILSSKEVRAATAEALRSEIPKAVAAVLPKAP